MLSLPPESDEASASNNVNRSLLSVFIHQSLFLDRKMLLLWTAAIVAITWLASGLIVPSSKTKRGQKPLPGPPGASSAFGAFNGPYPLTTTLKPNQ